MISLEIPVEQIPYIRTIEGRKFHDGKWQFPESALSVLKRLGLVPEEYEEKKQESIQYELSDYLRSYQKDIVNKALNSGSYGIFADTGTGKTCMGLELASHFKKSLIFLRWRIKKFLFPP